MKKITLCLMLILALIIVPGAIFAAEGDATEVSTAQELVNAVKTSGTVKLTQDIELKEKVTINSGVEITLDLNGKTLDLPDDSVTGYAYAMTVKGKLTITGNGTVDVNSSYGIATSTSGGILTVKNGTFNCLTGVYLIGNYGTTIIEGGTFNSNYCAVNGFNGKTVEVKGGKFTNNDSQPVLGTIEVTAGEFNQLIDGRYLGENADIKVTLDRDIETKSIEEDGFVRPSEVTIPEGCKVTIDLNGHNISGEDGSRKVIVVEGGELTVTGEGTIKEADPYYAPIYVSGNSNSKTTINIGKNVTLEGWAGVMVSSDAKNAKGIEINVDSKINSLTDASGVTGSGIYINGQVENKDIIEVNLSSSAVINSTGAGIYAAGYATWNINGSKITGVESGLGIKAGKFNIKNATITGTGEDKSPTTGYNNGINPSGAAIQLESNDEYVGDIELSISGGTYKSEQGMAIYEYLAKNPDRNIDTKETKVDAIKISSGNFTAAPNKEAVSVSTDFEETFSNGFITGGTFSSDVKEYISSELNTWENEDGTVEVVKERKIEMYVVAENGDVQFGLGAYSRDGYTVGRIGEKVYLSVEPEKDYEVVLTIKDAEGKDITYEKDYSFVMPDSDVSIKAEFIEKLVTPPAGDGNEGTVTPPAGDGNEGTVTPPAGDGNEGTVTPPAGDGNEGTVTPPAGEGEEGTVTPPADNDNTGNEDNTGNTTVTPPPAEGDNADTSNNDKKEEDVPQTGDNVVVYAVLAVVAMAGIAVTIKMRKK